MASSQPQSQSGTQALDIDDALIEEQEESLSSVEPDDLWGELLRTTSPGGDHAASPVMDGSPVKLGMKLTLQGPVERRFVIGRDDKADIRIQDPHVSSRHCIIFRDDNGHVWVEDHSLSGTFVNGERVIKNTRKRLANGDSLCLLRPAQHLHYSNTAGGGPTTPKGKSPTKAKNPHYHEFVFRSHAVPVGPCRGAINEKYEILDIVGSGSFATVRRGVDRRTGEEVAVKIVEKKNFQFEPERWVDQLKEIDMLKRVKHKYCVGLLDTYSTDDALYIVMEFIKGGELFDRVSKKGKIPEAATRVLIRRLLDAVSYLHREGIVHRDLKPENILIQHKDEHCFHIKVADFGVARLVGAGCKTLTGSLTYIAPEVLERKDTVHAVGTYDYACDMWSIGVIVYVCLMAKPPFRLNQEDDHAVQDLRTAVAKLLEFKGPDWSGISDKAKDFLTGLFQVNATKRLDAKGALKHPWIAEAADYAEGESCGIEAIPRGDDDHHEGDDDDGHRKRAKITPPVPLFSQ